MAVHEGVITTRILMQMAACVSLVLLGMGKPVSCQFDTVVILNDMPGEDLQTDCHSAGSFATLK